MFLLELSTAAIFLCVFLLSALVIQGWRPQNMPPGPKPWPLVGNLFQVAKEVKAKGLLDYTLELSQKYGAIFSLRMGPQNWVFLNDYETVKEVFVKQSEIFSIRPLHLLYIQRNAIIPVGVILSSGQKWKDMRRHALVALRDFGVGKKSIEGIINEEISTVIDIISGHGNESFDPWGFLPKAVSNVICTMCFGSRFDYDDTRFVDLLRRIKLFLGTGGVMSPANIFPLLRFLPSQKHIVQGKIENMAKINKFIDELIDTHKLDYDPNNIHDFVDLYIKKEQEETDKDSFSHENMQGLIRDLFVAGTETTATSLHWALLYMIINPEVQDKCQVEIDGVIGSGRLPTMTDRPNMPYIEATINEIGRSASVVAFGVPHCALKDASVNGYKILKDTIVMANIHAVHRDPQIWEDPEQFRPERWIKDGRFVQHAEAIPFSIGPRICLGESLARMEMFLFFTALLQKFKFEKENPEMQMNITGTFGSVYSPHPFKVRAKLH